MNHLTPKELAYVREWAKSGNKPRRFCAEEVQKGMRRNTITIDMQRAIHGEGRWATLNAAGLTIAALAEAFEQACETTELLWGATDSYLLGIGDKAELETVRKNRARLLG